MKHLQKTKTHDLYQVALHDRDMLPVIAYGSAGTGKTYGAIGAAVKWLDKCNTNIFVGTRPNVAFADEVGFLPGDVKEKMAPWVLPMKQNFIEHGYSNSHIDNLENTKVGRIQFHPLAHVQGLTFHNAFILVDECQNMTIEQIKGMMTRVGRNSKLVLCGDMAQTSPMFHGSGLAEFLEMMDFTGLKAHTINFNLDDCMRSQQCKDTIEAFEKWDAYKATRGVRAA